MAVTGARCCKAKFESAAAQGWLRRNEEVEKTRRKSKLRRARGKLVRNEHGELLGTEAGLGNTNLDANCEL